ncbi:DinB family protein [Pseudonocardia alaniniphila]|uniref:DinB family protein n=1 Tax=Pseudonocardia alaniniphila TaxID=75291 RepID=A0ABS9TPK1_9PSEU|nr:DinB family protein [Pseudonocardia alaniniphila]MCH6170478.1 DinB family protein [Pseudonocardia alaniniphila]
MTSTEATTIDERTDLLEVLATRRQFLRYTVQGLTDDQARQRTTASALCLGGLVKHVAEVERGWADFIVEGPSAVAGGGWDGEEPTQEVIDSWSAKFQLLPDETLAGVLAEYEEVARRTDELVRTLPDLGVSHPLPEAPWFEKGKRWSFRQVFLHIIAETTQHAGHADIIRESLDGQKTMG